MGISERFDMLNGSEFLRAKEVLTMGVKEAGRLRGLSANQRKSEKEKCQTT